MKRQAISSPEQNSGSIESPLTIIVKSYLGNRLITGNLSQSYSETDCVMIDSDPAAASRGIRGRVSILSMCISEFIGSLANAPFCNISPHPVRSQVGDNSGYANRIFSILLEDIPFPPLLALPSNPTDNPAVTVI